MSAPAARRGFARGAAVVLAMLLAALAAAVAVSVFADQQRWSHTVLHRRDQVQAQALALAGVQWARQILFDDRRSTGAVDHLGEPWAVTLPPIPLENGEIRGGIADAQARLNVNALGDTGARATVAHARLERLFRQRGVAPATVDAIADWIDSDDTTRPGGAEDGYYSAQNPPSLAANAPIARGVELADVRGVTAEALSALAPFIAALPRATPVNVNTAPPEVLAAIVDEANPAAISALVSNRAQKPYTTVAEFRARLPQGIRLANEEALAVSSDYFIVTIEARQGGTFARARALLRRGSDGWPAIVWQVVE
jgi:general secretion pathway protein K